MSKGLKGKKNKPGIFGSPSSGPLKASHTIVASGAPEGSKRKQHQWTSVYRAPPHSLITSPKPKMTSSEDGSKYAWGSSKNSQNFHKSSPLSPKNLARKGSKSRKKRGHSAKYEVVSSPVNSSQAGPKTSRNLFSGSNSNSHSKSEHKVPVNDEARGPSKARAESAKQRRNFSAKGVRKTKSRSHAQKRDTKSSKCSSSVPGSSLGKKVLIVGGGKTERSYTTEHSLRSIYSSGRSASTTKRSDSGKEKSSNKIANAKNLVKKTVTEKNGDSDEGDEVGDKILNDDSSNHLISRRGATPVDDDLVVDDIEYENPTSFGGEESEAKLDPSKGLSRDLNAMWNASVKGIARRQESHEKTKTVSDNSKKRNKVYRPSPPKDTSAHVPNARRFGESKSEANFRSLSQKSDNKGAKEKTVVDVRDKLESGGGKRVRFASYIFLYRA